MRSECKFTDIFYFPKALVAHAALRNSNHSRLFWDYFCRRKGSNLNSKSTKWVTKKIIDDENYLSRSHICGFPHAKHIFQFLLFLNSHHSVQLKQLWRWWRHGMGWRIISPSQSWAKNAFGWGQCRRIFLNNFFFVSISNWNSVFSSKRPWT